MAETNNQGRSQEKNGNFNFDSFVLKPLQSGIVGFILFLCVIIFTKFLASLLNSATPFILETEDLYLSGIGFVLSALIKFLENFRTE